MTDTQWESDCQFIQATLKDFNAWIQNKVNCGPFQLFNKDLHWAYADYIYMKNMFDGIPNIELTNEIDWFKLGFGKSEGQDMAIWIGSKGAYTVCHYDTYGYNLVVQVNNFSS